MCDKQCENCTFLERHKFEIPEKAYGIKYFNPIWGVKCTKYDKKAYSVFDLKHDVLK